MDFIKKIVIYQAMNISSIKTFEAKMLLPRFYFSVQSLLILLIPFLGYLCRHFTTPDLPLAFSVLWAPAGVSLAFVLLFGYGVWPAIFIGNLIYNVWSLAQTDRQFLVMTIESIVISSGSLLQALVGGLIIKKLSTPTYFYTVRDVLVFLIPAGIITCLIASSMASFIIYLLEGTSADDMLKTWLTFWLGDTIGVYIFTPLIVVLATEKFQYQHVDRFWEPFVMVVLLIFISWISFYKSYPVPQLLLPLCIWITYRFRMYGAVITTFLISVVAVVSSTMGRGVFVTYLSQDPLLYLVTFLCIIIGTNLYVAVLLNERAAAWKELESYSGGLQQHLESKTLELKEAHEELYFKEKLASIGMMMSGIGRELKKPLGILKSHLDMLGDELNFFNKIYQNEKHKLDKDTIASMENNFETMRQNMITITKDQEKILKIVNMIAKESDLSQINAPKVKSINLQTLLNRCLTQSLDSLKLTHPKLDIIINKEYDKHVEMIDGVPEDLTHAFMNLFENAFFSLAAKKKKSPRDFSPKLVVKTVNKPDSVIVSIWDNGGGLSETKMTNFFEPFMTEEAEFSGSGLSLAMTHDIIVQEHHGHISIESDGISSQQINIELPKTILKKKG